VSEKGSYKNLKDNSGDTTKKASGTIYAPRESVKPIRWFI